MESKTSAKKGKRESKKRNTFSDVGSPAHQKQELPKVRKEETLSRFILYSCTVEVDEKPDADYGTDEYLCIIPEDTDKKKKKKHAKLAWHLLDVMTWGTAGTNSWASGMSVLTLPSPWATLAKSVHNLKCLRKAKKTHKEQCVFMHMHCGHRFWCTDIKPNLCSLIPPPKKKKMFPCVKNRMTKMTVFGQHVMHFWFFEEMLWFTTWWLTSELYRSVQSLSTAWVLEINWISSWLRREPKHTRYFIWAEDPALFSTIINTSLNILLTIGGLQMHLFESALTENPVKLQQDGNKNTFHCAVPLCTNQTSRTDLSVSRWDH